MEKIKLEEGRTPVKPAPEPTKEVKLDGRTVTPPPIPPKTEDKKREN